MEIDDRMAMLKTTQSTEYCMEETIVKPWLDLYETYKGVKCGASEDYRRFKAWTGCSPDVCEFIFCKYNLLPNRTHLLIVLTFLKNMPSEDEGSSNFRICRPTYRKYLWDTLFYLKGSMNEVWAFQWFRIISLFLFNYYKEQHMLFSL